MRILAAAALACGWQSESECFRRRARDSRGARCVASTGPAHGPRAGTILVRAIATTVHVAQDKHLLVRAQGALWLEAIDRSREGVRSKALGSSPTGRQSGEVIKMEGKSILSHGFKRAPSLFETQSALGWGVIVVLLSLVGVVYLAQGSQKIITGYQMQQLTVDIKELQERNVYLEAQIAAAQSLEDLRSRARALGFVDADPERIEYLRVDGYPTTPGPIIIPESPAPPEPIGGLSNWWQGLMRGFTGWTQGTSGGGS